jgi:hypothetical protein
MSTIQINIFILNNQSNIQNEQLIRNIDYENPFDILLQMAEDENFDRSDSMCSNASTVIY